MENISKPQIEIVDFDCCITAGVSKITLTVKEEVERGSFSSQVFTRHCSERQRLLVEMCIA
jgi:hypothetical protein